MVFLGAGVGDIYSQTMHSTNHAQSSHLMEGVQEKVNLIQSNNQVGLPSAELLQPQINSGSIDDQINKDLQRQRGFLARHSGGIVRVANDGKNFVLGGLPENLHTTISPNGDFQIKYIIRF